MPVIDVISLFVFEYSRQKSRVPLDASMSERETRALDNMQKAIVMHEAIERTTIHQCKSFLPHGCVFKITRDILTVADLHAYNTSPLELQNAKTKRAAKSGGSRRLEAATCGYRAARDVLAAVVAEWSAMGYEGEREVRILLPTSDPNHLTVLKNANKTRINGANES